MDFASGRTLANWRRERGDPSLSEVHRSIAVAAHGSPGGKRWRLSRARLSRRRRLHGPGQLGDVARRRRQVRLRAALRRARCRTSWRSSCSTLCARWRSRPGATSRRPAATPIPRAVASAALVAGRNRDLRHRPRRSHRHGDRPQPALRHTARDRRHRHRARRVPDPLPAEQGLSLDRGLHHHAARRHRRLLPRPDRAGRPGMGRGDPRLRADDARSSPTRTCSISRSASSARR